MFSCSARVDVFESSSDWFPALFTSVVICQINYFDFDFDNLLLKGHCDFAAFGSKLLECLIKNLLFFNLKLLLQHREEKNKVFLLEEQTIISF